MLNVICRFNVRNVLVYVHELRMYFVKLDVSKSVFELIMYYVFESIPTEVEYVQQCVLHVFCMCSNVLYVQQISVVWSMQQISVFDHSSFFMCSKRIHWVCKEMSHLISNTNWWKSAANLVSNKCSKFRDFESVQEHSWKRKLNNWWNKSVLWKKKIQCSRQTQHSKQNINRTNGYYRANTAIWFPCINRTQRQVYLQYLQRNSMEKIKT